MDKIREKLKAHHGSDVELDLKMFIEQPSMKVGTALPPLYYRYKVGSKWKKSYVTFNFCPFCGKKS